MTASNKHLQKKEEKKKELLTTTDSVRVTRFQTRKRPGSETENNFPF